MYGGKTKLRKKKMYKKNEKRERKGYTGHWFPKWRIKSLRGTVEARSGFLNAAEILKFKKKKDLEEREVKKETKIREN